MRENWINGRGAPSRATEEIAVVNPATEQVVETIPQGAREDVEDAVAAARAAQPAWAALSPNDRRNALRGVVARIAERRDEIARRLTEENGKPLAQARGEVGVAIDTATSFIELLPHLRSGNQGAMDADLIFQHREARGVAGCIVPWNFPIAVGLENVIPNLGVGNAVIWKPSEKTPLSSALIAETCFSELPPGVINLVLGNGPDCGEHLVRHDDIDLIVFVGSERTGRAIGAHCGGALKKAILELGGKDPFIVDDTVDIDRAAALCAEATYANAGQICTSTERIFVQRRIFDAFRDTLVDISARLRVGDGLEDGTEMGPLVDHLQLETVSGQIEDARRRGADVHTGGLRPNRVGYFYPPTVLSNVASDTRLMNEETFGPVAPLAAFDEFDEAIALANDCRYGLAAIVCTTSAPRAIEAVHKLQAGMVKINTMRGKAPGGTSEPFKSSGLGHGYGVEFLMEITRQKSVHWRAAPH